MNKLSPEQWLAVGIALVFIIVGIRVLKQSAAKKDRKYPDFFFARGGGISLLIMAASAASCPFLANPKRLIAAVAYTIALLINGLYWFIRRVSYDLKEVRRNRHAKSENF